MNFFREMAGTTLLAWALKILPKPYGIELAKAIYPVSQLWKQRAFGDLPEHLQQKVTLKGGTK